MLPMETLKTFLAAAESGSFTRAGDRVNLTQSAVSMQIKRLEQELGKALFERGGRGIALTKDGEVLLGYARRILELHDEVLADIMGPQVQGAVRLGAPEDYAQSVLPGILAGFCRQYPKVRVEVRVESSDRLRVALAVGALDVCLLTCAAEDEAEYVVHREPVVWVGAAGHEAHLADPLPLAVYHQGCPYRKWALDSLGAMGRDYRIVVESPSLAVLMATARAGLGVLPVGRSQVQPGLRILGRSEGFGPLPEGIISLNRAESRTSPASMSLCEHIIEAFTRL